MRGANEEGVTRVDRLVQTDPISEASQCLRDFVLGMWREKRIADYDICILAHWVGAAGRNM